MLYTLIQNGGQVRLGYHETPAVLKRGRLVLHSRLLTTSTAYRYLYLPQSSILLRHRYIAFGGVEFSILFFHFEPFPNGILMISNIRIHDVCIFLQNV